MLHLLLYGVLAILLGGVLFAAAARFLPAGEQIAPPVRDEPPWELPPDRVLRAEDVDAVRLPVALRGYRFAETDQLLDRIAGELRARDAELARLRGELPVDADVPAGAVEGEEPGQDEPAADEMAPVADAAPRPDEPQVEGAAPADEASIPADQPRPAADESPAPIDHDGEPADSLAVNEALDESPPAGEEPAGEAAAGPAAGAAADPASEQPAAEAPAARHVAPPNPPQAAPPWGANRPGHWTSSPPPWAVAPAPWPAQEPPPGAAPGNGQPAAPTAGAPEPARRSWRRRKRS